MSFANRILPVLVLLALSTGRAFSQDGPESDVDMQGSAFPLEEWRDAGEIENIPWELRVSDSELRMDQRIEVTCTGRIRAEDLELGDVAHDLFLKMWVRSRETGEWLAEADAIHYGVEAGIPENIDIAFDILLYVTPGDYDLAVMLVDRTTGRHSLEIERMEVDNPDDDWFPDAYADVPFIEFPDTNWLSDPVETEGTGDLKMPLDTERGIDVEVIAMLSTPEQHADRSDDHQENMQDALVAISQLDVANGLLSIRGLDLIERRQVFEQNDVDMLDVDGLNDAIEAANQYAISVDNLLSRLDNPMFLRDFVESRVSPYFGPNNSEDPLKVFVFLSGITRFDDDADVREIRVDGDCACLAFHVRIRLFLRDLFDQVEDIIDPLDPETYSINTPNDLREALGRIVREIEEH